MSKAVEVTEDFTGLNILPDGTRVFVRDAFLFGDISQRVGKICAFNVDCETAEWLGTPELEYLLRFQDGKEHWVSASQVEGFIRAV